MWLLGWPLGLLLSSLSGVFGVLGKLSLKLAHLQALNPKARRLYLLGGLVAMLALNPALGAAAYCFASQSLLAPMAGLSIGWNTLLGPMLLPHERLTAHDIAGALLIFAGCVLVGVAGTHEAPPLAVDEIAARFSSPPFVFYSVGLLLLVTALAHHARFALNLSKAETPTSVSQSARVTLSALSGVVSGQLFFLAAAMRVLHDGVDAAVWKQPVAYVCISGSISTALLGLHLLNEALKIEDAVVVVNLYEASYILTGAISGLCFFQDMTSLSSWHLIVYSLSLMLILVGIYVVAKRSTIQPERGESYLPLLVESPIDVDSPEQTFQKVDYFTVHRASSTSRLLQALRVEEESKARRNSIPLMMTVSA